MKQILAGNEGINLNSDLQLISPLPHKMCLEPRSHQGLNKCQTSLVDFSNQNISLMMELKLNRNGIWQIFPLKLVLEPSRTYCGVRVFTPCWSLIVTLRCKQQSKCCFFAWNVLVCIRFLCKEYLHHIPLFLCTLVNCNKGAYSNKILDFIVLNPFNLVMLCTEDMVHMTSVIHGPTLLRVKGLINKRV